jgi:hypothetical protein
MKTCLVFRMQFCYYIFLFTYYSYNHSSLSQWALMSFSVTSFGTERALVAAVCSWFFALVTIKHKFTAHGPFERPLVWNYKIVTAIFSKANRVW